ncbi:MAG TPA: LysR substrate-binding domain-containing protein [Burkholderiales bacterium]|nr:LysR substrate-binding domain-containing protein [Burkholderiales bacterium]
MEFRHLLYFLKLADILSFTRAAEQLHITQPTLSHFIKKLESQVGARLFERVGRNVRLTPAGSTLQEYAQKAIRELDSAATAITELQGLVKGSVAIGVNQPFNSLLIPPIVSKFSTAYPGIHVTVQQMSKRIMEERLFNAELDFGISYKPSFTEKVQAEDLFDEVTMLIVGKGHPLYGVKRIELAQLGNLPLAMLTPEFSVRSLVEDAFATFKGKPLIRIENNSVDAILETVRYGKLATILAPGKPSTMRGLHCIELHPAFKRTAAIFWCRTRYRSGAARALADLITETYAGPLGHHPRPARATARSRKVSV